MSFEGNDGKGYGKKESFRDFLFVFIPLLVDVTENTPRIVYTSG